MKSIFFMALVLMASTAMAGEQVGTVTQVQGSVKLFTHPGKRVQGPPPHALYEGEYYSVSDVKIGDRVDQGNILRTAPGAKARVVFDNGDQFNVGPGTAYRVFWDQDSVKGSTKVSLMYGKLRGVVEKGGPRSRMTIRTRSATMGVRGTDFFIADGGADGGTEVSILRGEVEVKPIVPEAKPIAVKAGYSAEVLPPPAPVAPVEAKNDKAGAKPLATETKPAPVPVPVVELRRTTQEDLTAIQKSSTVKVEVRKELAAVDDTAKKVERLEAKAVETTIKDIKAGDPQLYAKIQGKTVQTTEELNAQAVQQIMKEAPRAPTKRKPFKSELEDLENGAYEKFFRIID